MDFLACEPRPALDVSATSLLVLDEADRMLDMGFAHELRSAAACPPTLARPYIFCTALLPRHSEPPSSLPVGLKSSTALSCSGIIQRLPAPAGRQVQPPPPCAAPYMQPPPPTCSHHTMCSPHHLHATPYVQPPTCRPHTYVQPQPPPPPPAAKRLRTVRCTMVSADAALHRHLAADGPAACVRTAPSNRHRIGRDRSRRTSRVRLEAQRPTR